MARPSRFLRRSRRDPDGTMSLVDHLQELRDRLVRSVGAVALGSVVGWFLYEGVLDLLLRPYCAYLATVPERLRPPQGDRKSTRLNSSHT